MGLTDVERRQLIAVARESIEMSIESRTRSVCPQREWTPAQRQHRSAFVTLRIGSELRGCCGSIDAARPLVEEVWNNAWASAFGDPRFPPLAAPEWAATRLHISVLQPSEPLRVDDEASLLARLRPGRDGLILELGAARATFLPSVWEQLPEPQAFLRHLKRKAGWDPEFWSPHIRISRYEAEGFSET